MSENDRPSRQSGIHWDTFKSALVSSSCNIDGQFFAVQRYAEEGPEQVQRERVYCYELYHQLRSRLGDSFPYVLHGELDKRGQEFIETRMKSEPVPDFVVHRPGRIGFEDQLVAIEVKTCQGFSVAAGQRDVDKLVGFVQYVGYLHGILLVVGSCSDQHGVAGIASSLVVSDERIHVLWHWQVGQSVIALCSNEDWTCFDETITRYGDFWSDWCAFPRPDEVRYLHAPFGPGVYELRLRDTGELVLFGSGRNVAYRMTSLLAKPLGQGHRNNQAKCEFILRHLNDIEYRTLACPTESEARRIERQLQQLGTYRFDT